MAAGGSGATAQPDEEREMKYSMKPKSRYAAYRSVIAALIRALCAVPKEARKEWIHELFEAGTGTEVVSPDELVVRQVLANLDVAESVADRRREEERPKLYPIVGREIVTRRERRAGDKMRSSGGRESGEPPRAA